MNENPVPSNALKRTINNLSSSPSTSKLEYPDKQNVMTRNRKNRDQLKVLIQEYKGQSCWDKDLITGLAEKTGLSFGQIYKWHWDYRKKNKKKIRKSWRIDLTCFESLSPLEIEKSLYVNQKLYSFQFFGK